MGAAAGTQAVEVIKKAIENKGRANIILATGTSQFETLKKLLAARPAPRRGGPRGGARIEQSSQRMASSKTASRPGTSIFTESGRQTPIKRRKRGKHREKLVVAVSIIFNAAEMKK